MAQKSGKKSSPRGGAGKKNWAKIAVPVFLILIMVLSIFAILTSNNNQVSDTDSSSTEINFNSIIEGLRIIPPGADYARYIDLTANAEINTWAMSNLNTTIPDSKAFGGQAKKDLLVNYPLEFFGPFNEQWVSITDFGPKYQITNPNQTTYQGVSMRAINPVYTYSETRPTVSGRIQNVADMILFWSSSPNKTAYNEYSDLTDQLKGYPINASQARLSVVGTSSLLNTSDRYYAGLTPTSDGKYNYQAVLHLNETLNETEKQDFKSRTEQVGIFVMKFDSYQIQFQGDYLILQATGNLTTCTNDMVDSWRFLKA